MSLRLSPPKDPFPVRKLVTSERSWSSARGSIRDQTRRRLCSKTSQPLTFLYQADRGVSSAVPTPISDFKVHHRYTSTGFHTLRRPNTLQRTLSPIAFQIHLDSLRPKVTYQGSHLQVYQCRLNAVFQRSEPTITATLSSAVASS
ncbi:hypothetical protein TNCV_1983021 [Trichonephila clavipes]|nr:hypothetical protein TNCV_1983021 [Trichonephila clavipes]